MRSFVQRDSLKGGAGLSYRQEELEQKTMVELYRIARELDIAGYSKLRKAELIHEIHSCIAGRVLIIF